MCEPPPAALPQRAERPKRPRPSAPGAPAPAAAALPHPPVDATRGASSTPVLAAAAAAAAAAPAPAQPPPGALPLPRLALVDGSQLEGGGQILRLSAALAAVLGVRLRVHSVRAGRTPPGLRAQHLAGLQLVARLCAGSLAGGALGSSDVALEPGPQPPAGGASLADTGTAGSVALLAQAALPVALFSTSPSVLTLRGGTDAALAPPCDYLALVLLPLLRTAVGLEVGMRVVRRGFYPRGGGEAVLTCAAPLPAGAALPPLRLTERGTVVSLAVSAFWAGTDETEGAAARALAAAAAEALRCCPPTPGGGPGGNAAVAVAVTVAPCGPGGAVGAGLGATLVATTSTGCVLGESVLVPAPAPLRRRGGGGGGGGDDDGAQPRALLLAAAAAEGASAGARLAELLATAACVDGHAADQVVVFMALAGGESAVVAPHPLSLHARTAIAVAAALTGAAFDVRPPAPGGGGAGDGATCTVVCAGAGVRARGPVAHS